MPEFMEKKKSNSNRKNKVHFPLYFTGSSSLDNYFLEFTVSNKKKNQKSISDSQHASLNCFYIIFKPLSLYQNSKIVIRMRVIVLYFKAYVL